MNDVKGHILNEKITTFKRSVHHLQSNLHNVLKHEGTLSKSYATLAQDLHEFAQMESFQPMQTLLFDLSKCITEIENHRANIISGRIQQTVVNKLKEVDEFCIKPTDLMIIDRQNAIKASIKSKSQLEAMTAKGAKTAKVEAKLQQLNDNKKKAKNINQAINVNILKNIELLTQASQQLNRIDESQSKAVLSKELENANDATVTI